MTSNPCDAVIIGAGPYGLAAAAHLRAMGADARVFGAAMYFWRRHMPKGMFLRSHRDASYVADPHSALRLDAFERAQGRRIPQPTPLEDFIAYGLWFQQREVPDLDSRLVAKVEANAHGFLVMLADGEAVATRRVIVAAGISPFAWRPPQFDGLPRTQCTHSSDHADVSSLSGSRVLVVGGGQSAFECAVLILEAGGDVELVMRASAVRWLGRSEWLGTLRAVLFPSTDVGPALLGHVAGRPSLFRRLTPGLQRDLARLSTRPAVAGWLRRRAQDLTITLGRRVVSATPSDGRLRLQLDDGSARFADHVVLATGYRVDIGRYGFLAPVLGSVRQIDGYPDLDDGFQSSVRGLHFLGAPAAHSFGPVARFVSGTEFTARALVRSLRMDSASDARSAPGRAFDFPSPERRPP